MNWSQAWSTETTKATQSKNPALGKKRKEGRKEGRESEKRKKRKEGGSKEVAIRYESLLAQQWPG